MGYISSGENFQPLGRFGCGGTCGCAQYAARRFGNRGLAEWYEEDNEPDPPASSQPTANGSNGSAMGEAPERFVLQPPQLLQPPVPAWERRMRRWMDGNLPKLRLDPQFMPLPGGVPGVPPAPPPPRQIDLRPSPQYERELMERWEREPLNRILVTPPPSPPLSVSLGEAIRRYLDTNLESLLNNLRVPRSLRGPIRNAARDAIGRGATEALDSALNAAGVSNSQIRNAIGASVRAAMETIRVR